ncbi:hypothetical protein DTO96_102412 [Ephemeroptericola cinctiostellae]|uniref:Mor transcription activator domain-containing protein n=1 Tax=Ephemeroptericola cinctiostellae TaxID=2268024 RepID=A0A345DE69_9BURK|nr:hypothetical protein DTO96_102412 [Ephemeroptericola cinctiostellae]
MTVLDSLASLIGFSETCVLAAVYGGRSLSVPKKLNYSHPLALLIGLEAAKVLASEFGGGSIKISPLIVYDRYANLVRANQLASSGLSVAMISRELRVSLRTVHGYLRDAKSLKVQVFSLNMKNKKHQKMKRIGSLPLPSPCESSDPRGSGQFELF